MNGSLIMTLSVHDGHVELQAFPQRRSVNKGQQIWLTEILFHGNGHDRVQSLLKCNLILTVR